MAANPSNYTIRIFIDLALQLINQKGIQEMPTAYDYTTCLAVFANMLDGLNANNNFIYNLAEDVFYTQVGKQDYTMGIGEDINTTVPVDGFTDATTMFLNSVNMNLSVVTKQQFNSRGQSNLSGIPSMVYYNNTYPIGIVSLYPIPSQVFEVHLVSRKALTVNCTLDTVIDFPAGYSEYVLYEFAERLSAFYNYTFPPSAYAILANLRRELSTRNIVLPEISAYNSSLGGYGNLANMPYNPLPTPAQSVVIEWTQFIGAGVVTGANSFNLTGDVSSYFPINRQLYLTSTMNSNNIYGYVASCNFVNSETQVTLGDPTSNLTSDYTTIFYSNINPLHNSLPNGILWDGDLAGYAQLNNATFSNIYMPLRPPKDNSTAGANTAYVDNAVANTQTYAWYFSNYTCTYASQTSFTINTSDQPNYLVANQRIYIKQSTNPFMYGTITTATYANNVWTVNVTFDNSPNGIDSTLPIELRYSIDNPNNSMINANYYTYAKSLISPAFSGTPTAPNITYGSETQQIVNAYSLLLQAGNSPSYWLTQVNVNLENNLITGNAPSIVTNYVLGMKVYLGLFEGSASFQNVPSLNVNNIGAKPIYFMGDPTGANILPLDGGVYEFVYDGSIFWCTNAPIYDFYLPYNSPLLTSVPIWCGNDLSDKTSVNHIETEQVEALPVLTFQITNTYIASSAAYDGLTVAFPVDVTGNWSGIQIQINGWLPNNVYYPSGANITYLPQGVFTATFSINDLCWYANNLVFAPNENANLTGIPTAPTAIGFGGANRVTNQIVTINYLENQQTNFTVSPLVPTLNVGDTSNKAINAMTMTNAINYALANNSAWITYSGVPTALSDTQFVVDSDISGLLYANQRVLINAIRIVYSGWIVSAIWSSGDNTTIITVAFDYSGSSCIGMSSFEYSMINSSNLPNGIEDANTILNNSTLTGIPTAPTAILSSAPSNQVVNLQCLQTEVNNITDNVGEWNISPVWATVFSTSGNFVKMQIQYDYSSTYVENISIMLTGNGNVKAYGYITSSTYDAINDITHISVTMQDGYSCPVTAGNPILLNNSVISWNGLPPNVANLTSAVFSNIQVPTQSASDNSTNAASTAFCQSLLLGPTLLDTSLIYGMEIQVTQSPAIRLIVAKGTIAMNNAVYNFVGMSKIISAQWSAGTGNGALIGSLLPNSPVAPIAWYSVYAIGFQDGSCDICVIPDTCFAPYAMLPGNVVAYRRIGAIATNYSAYGVQSGLDDQVIMNVSSFTKFVNGATCLWSVPYTAMINKGIATIYYCPSPFADVMGQVVGQGTLSCYVNGVTDASPIYCTILDTNNGLSTSVANVGMNTVTLMTDGITSSSYGSSYYSVDVDSNNCVAICTAGGGGNVDGETAYFYFNSTSFLFKRRYAYQGTSLRTEFITALVIDGNNVVQAGYTQWIYNAQGFNQVRNGFSTLDLNILAVVGMIIRTSIDNQNWTQRTVTAVSNVGNSQALTVSPSTDLVTGTAYYVQVQSYY